MKILLLIILFAIATIAVGQQVTNTRVYNLAHELATEFEGVILESPPELTKRGLKVRIICVPWSYDFLEIREGISRVANFFTDLYRYNAWEYLDERFFMSIYFIKDDEILILYEHESNYLWLVPRGILDFFNEAYN